MDNWEHRSKNMLCASCMWFVPKKVSDQESKIGRCRRRAPTEKGWSPVYKSDWCGDHRLDETKVS